MATPQNSTPAQTDIKKFQKRLVKSHINDVLSRFKLSHLTSDVIVNLFELVPGEIESKVKKLKLPFSKTSVVELLTTRCKDFNLDELQDISNALLLYFVAFQSKLKKWSTLHFLDPEDNCQCETDLRQIRLNILQAFRIKGLNAIVKVIEHEERIWIMIIEKKLTRRKGVRLLNPVFLCYEPGIPYVFAASSVSEVVIECLLKSMQYKKHKVHQLEGRDVKSLLAVIKQRAANRNNSQLVVYNPAEFEMNHRITDYSKRKARVSYAEKLFTVDDSLKLETFTVNADVGWYKNCVVPEMEGEPFKATMKLKSSNLIKMVKSLVANDLVRTPLPDYVKTILNSGKNKISITVSG